MDHAGVPGSCASKAFLWPFKEKDALSPHKETEQTSRITGDALFLMVGECREAGAVEGMLREARVRTWFTLSTLVFYLVVRRGEIIELIHIRKNGGHF